ncbi:Alanine--tRNA ligase [Bienertia sinuspersici]
MASTTSIALILSLKPFSQLSSQQLHNNNLRFLFPPASRPFLSPATVSTRRNRIVGCLISGFGGGGLSDTRKSEFSREFAVIATMLKRIEPLDTSDISKGVSDSAKDSMKQTISTMLGLLPSEQFSVSVRASKVPLHHLLVSSIITGYTLWNAEYRISLMRNFELSMDSSKSHSFDAANEQTSGSNCREKQSEGANACIDLGIDSPEQITPDSLKDLSPEALRYIQHLEAELNSAKKELDAQKQDLVQTESNRGNSNNLLEYLRSLESSMVSELSQPSSVEVKEVIHELVQNTIQRFFKDDPISEPIESTAIASIKDHQVGSSERNEVVTTSRDYLAKLLFWFVISYFVMINTSIV